jgi:hypothetical protein
MGRDMARVHLSERKTRKKGRAWSAPNRSKRASSAAKSSPREPRRRAAKRRAGRAQKPPQKVDWRVGALVEVEVEGDAWLPGTLSSVDAKKRTMVVALDDSDMVDDVCGYQFGEWNAGVALPEHGDS